MAPRPTAEAELRALVERGRRMVEFCLRVRARGGRAEVEEDVDLVAMRVEYITRLSALRARAAA